MSGIYTFNPALLKMWSAVASEQTNISHLLPF